MAFPVREVEEPLTPMGRLFVRPEIDVDIYCTLGLEGPLDVGATKSVILDSFFLRHPRFCSLVSCDHPSGVETWRPTHVDVDRHLVVVDHRVSFSADDSDAVNDYVSEMATGPGLSRDKPLWEIHLLVTHRCIVFRVSHSLVDGISLMAMVMSACRTAGDPTAAPKIPAPARSEPKNDKGKRVMENVVWFLGVVWFTAAFGVEMLMKMTWKRDPRTAIIGGDGVEWWPRKLATAHFRLEDMQVVKRAVSNATINDVFVGVISSGLKKYLDHRTPAAVREGIQITGVSMVNVRKQPGLPELSDLTRSNSKSRWGNKFGVFLLPIRYPKNDNLSSNNRLQFVKKIKVLLDRKKQSLEAQFSYKSHSLLSFLGSKFVNYCMRRMVRNTSFVISNIVGPSEEITIGDNLVTFMRVNTSSDGHGLIMHLLSYAGRAELQLLVAKDIIPDPEFLAKCFEDALLEMKQEATT